MGITAKIQVNLLRILKGHKQAVYSICSVRNGVIYTAGGDGFIVKWNPLDSDNGIVVATVPEPIYTMECNKKSDVLYVGSQSGYLYEIQNGNARKIEAHSRGLYSILLADSGLITVGGDGKLIQWNEELNQKASKQLSKKALRKIISIPGGFAVGGSEGLVFLLSLEFNIWDQWDNHGSTVFALEFEQETKRIFYGGRDALIHQRDILQGNEAEIKAHLLHIHDLKLAPDNSVLASASMDKTIKIWDTKSFDLLKVLDANKFGIHTSSVNALVWINPSTLVAVSDDRNVGVFEILRN